MTWQRLADDPDLLTELNRIKMSAAGMAAYEEVKAAFFDSVLER